MLLVVAFIPLGELPQAFAEGDLRSETEVALQGGGVCVGGGHIAGLHGYQLLVGVEVEILRQDTGSDELLLQDVHEVQQVLGLPATDVIHGIGRHGQAVLPYLTLGRSLHHTDNALHNVVHIGEVAATVAVVKDLDSLALQELVGEAEVRHVGAPSGAVYGEETQTGRRNVVELGVAMRKEFVALLRGRIEAHGVVHTIIRRKRHLLVAAIDAGAGSINQMLHGVVAAGFKNVIEANHVALDIGVGILYRVTHAGLCCEIHDDVELIFGEQGINNGLICKISLDEVPVHF